MLFSLLGKHEIGRHFSSVPSQRPFLSFRHFPIFGDFKQYSSLSSIIDALENACNSRLWTLTTSINCCQKWHIVIETLCYLLSLGCVSTSIKKHLKVKAKTKNRLYYFLNKKRQYFSLILEKTASINCCHKWRILIETLCLLLSLGCVSTPMNYYSFKFSLYI